MTYEQIVKKVKARFDKADASDINGITALQVNLEGKKVNGIFYIEVKDHKINVEPFEYYDRNAVITVNPTNLMKIVEGKLDATDAYNSGKLAIDGNTNAVFTVMNLLNE